HSNPRRNPFILLILPPQRRCGGFWFPGAARPAACAGFLVLPSCNGCTACYNGRNACSEGVASMPIIAVDQLCKDFTYTVKSPGLRGAVRNLLHRETKTKHAVCGVSFSVERGEAVGLLG